MGCDAISLDVWFLAFRKFEVPPSSGDACWTAWRWRWSHLYVFERQEPLTHRVKTTLLLGPRTL